MNIKHFNLGSLYLADCLDVLKTLEDSSIDIILTDPPYNIKFAEWDVFENVEEVILQ